MNFLVAPLVIGIITLGIYKLFELFVCRRERLTLIEKISENTLLPIDKLSLNGIFRQRSSFGALKAGCLLVGIGFGLLIGYFIGIASVPYYVEHLSRSEVIELTGIVFGASVLLFGGLGLLIAFLIELKIEKSKNQTL